MGIDYFIHITKNKIELEKFANDFASRYGLRVEANGNRYILDDAATGGGFVVFDDNQSKKSIPLAGIKNLDRSVSFRGFNPNLIEERDIKQLLILRDLIDRRSRLVFERDGEVLLLKNKGAILLRHDSWHIWSYPKVLVFLPHPYMFCEIPEGIG